MRGLYSLGMAAVIGGLAVVAPAREAQHHMGRTRYSAGSYKRVHGNSPAGKPHSHSREIARRLRQEERDLRRQCERGYICLSGEWHHIRNKGRGLRPVFPGELIPMAIAA